MTAPVLAISRLDAPFPSKRAGVRRGAALAWAAAPSDVAAEADIRRRRGAAAHRAGLAAEDAVARRYARAGAAVLARRWRCPYGEIDLILREPEGLVFVEVKRRARALVDDPVGERQWRRLEAAAQYYMLIAETGDAPMRFDLALVGADGAIEVTDNARC
ncbi:MAG: YraN family protein [Pseudomonadota bacterium]